MSDSLKLEKKKKNQNQNKLNHQVFSYILYKFLTLLYTLHSRSVLG